MDHIVVNIQPFLAKQEVAVYQNGECIKTIKCKMLELDKTCYALCKEFNIDQVDVAGMPIFAKKLKDSIVSDKFNDFKINVELH